MVPRLAVYIVRDDKKVTWFNRQVIFIPLTSPNIVHPYKGLYHVT
jgi:hypothetical protein